MSAILPEVPHTYEEPPAPAAVTRRASQPSMEERPVRGTRRDRIESLITFLIVAVAAFLAGYHVLTTNHVVVFTALQHLTEAFQVLWDSPPKLAAIGFSSPPIPTILMVPFAAIKPLASSLTALPLYSAVFFGGTVMILGRLLRTCEFPFLARIPILLAFTVSPMWVFYGTNGDPDMVYLFFLAAGLYSFVCWYRGHATIHLIAAGTALSFCMLSRYGLIAMAALLALMIGAALYRRGSDQEEVEGSVVGFLAPCVYAFALWALLNAAIIGSPFGWLGNSASTLSINSAQSQHMHAYSLSNVASHMFTVVIDSGPLALLALPLLIVMFILRRDTLSLWLAGLMALTVLLVGSGAVTAGQVDRVVLSNGLSVELVAVVAIAYVYSIATTLRLPVFAAMLAVLVLAIPLAWNGMLKYPYQDMEQSFVHALQHSGRNLTGEGSRGGYTVGVEAETQMAAYIKQHVSGHNHQVLIDNAQSYGVIILTGRPQVFIDRSQHGDGQWEKRLNNPYGHVGYMLISTSGGDLIRERYPLAISGNNPDLKPIYQTRNSTGQGYDLVRVTGAPPSQVTNERRSAVARSASTSSRAHRIGAAKPSGIAKSKPTKATR